MNFIDSIFGGIDMSKQNDINIHINFAPVFIISDAKAAEIAADTVKEFFAPLVSKQDGKQPENENK